MPVRFFQLFERTQDVTAIAAARAEAAEVTNTIAAFLQTIPSAFDATDTNDPKILHIFNTVYNTILIGKWEVSLNPSRSVKTHGARVLAQISKNHIQLFCLGRLVALMRLLQCSRQIHDWPEKQAETKHQAEKIVYGLVKKLHAPELQGILQHEINHALDAEHGWFHKSRFTMWRQQGKAYDKATKEVTAQTALDLGKDIRGNQRDYRVSLHTGRVLNITKSAKDRAEWQDRLADQYRYVSYRNSSHEYNAETRAAMSIALAKKRSWEETVKVFKKSFIGFGVLTLELRRKALRRLYLAYQQQSFDKLT